MVLHLLRRMPFWGNPRCFSEWADEGLNKLLKGACRQVSQATFEVAVLSSMNALLSRPIARKRDRGE